MCAYAPGGKIVNPGKLVKRIRREAAANPKKAAVLGILVAVSIYFWAPLVFRWLSVDKGSLASQNTAVVPPAKSAAPGSTPAARADNRPSWQQIDGWMRNDPRTMSATPASIGRDPFGFPADVVAKTVAEEELKKQTPSISPDRAGLTLSGTVIGPRDRVARINGRTYRVGETIDVKDKKTTVQAAFKVMEVQPRSVILQSGPERYELSLPDPAKSGKIEFQRTGP